MKYKVVLTDSTLADWEQEKQKFAAADAELVFIDTADPGKVATAVVDADAVIVGYAQIGADVIQGMQKCKSISKMGIGVNNIDVQQATKRGIRVLNVPDYCIEEVSDTVIALTLSLTRRIPFLWDNVRRGDWSRSGSENIIRLSGKVFGFLGFGNIARRTADKIRPYGVKLLAYDPYIDVQAALDAGVELAGLNELIRDVDILSLNLPLSAETKGIVNRDVFSRMKKSAYLINAARGPLVNEEDLCEAILKGEIAGAGLDVIRDEAYNPENRLFTLPNVVITPHAAYYSIESEKELRDKAFADVLAVLAGNEPKYQVNSI